MYLKGFESVGFKSFAERINMTFVPGVTVIVGPNGSGKSNITDAIRWVLGEQSVKSLRGSKMEDIIFQGSDTRSPLNVAEVTLLLDNSSGDLPLDYNEVSVTRRVYRSGVSEFYINKQACRLKDIIDLFMDSGLGREAFSTISQGKVEEVLSANAEDRRSIFEEAAGVLKYKQRKRKSEYKLAETEENLSRVDDIIYEIESQTDPLYDQAEIAKTYIKQKELLKQQEISLLITEIEQKHEEWQKLLAELDEERITEIHLKTSIQLKEATLESDRHKMNEIDETIEKLQARLLKATQQLEQYEGTRQVLSERTKHSSENKESLASQKKEVFEQVERISIELIAEKEKLSEAELIRSATEQKIKQLAAELMMDEDSIKEQIEKLKQEHIELLNKQAAENSEAASIKEQLEQVGGEKDTQAGEYKQVTELKGRLTQQQVNASIELKVQNKTYSKRVKHMNQLKTALDEERTLFETSEKELYELYRMIARLESRKEMLQEMKVEFQGFFHGVKAILKAREEKVITNIYGAVIELIDVQEEYVTAIETVLGSQAQHVIVKDDQAARYAIDWLKQTNNGRATFLPLGSIRSRFLTGSMLKEVENHPGFINIAGRLVTTDERYQTAINHLMGHVIIAKTLKDANDIARVIKRKNRVVTLDGDVVNPGGSMSGGAKKQTNQSLFTREKDLEEATIELANVQAEVKELESKVDLVSKQMIQTETALSKEELAVSESEEQVRIAETVYRDVETELRVLKDTILMHDRNREQSDLESKVLTKRQEELVISLASVNKNLLTVQAKINLLTKQDTEFKVSHKELQEKLQKYEVTLAKEEERVRSRYEKTVIIETQLANLQEQHSEYEHKLNELIDVDEIKVTELKVIDHIAASQIEKDTIIKDIQDNRATRSLTTQLMQDQERELKEEHKKHQVFIQMIQQKEVKANRLDVDLENRLSQLQTQYTITYEKARSTYEKTVDVKAAKEYVTELKYTIKQLGTVNLGAIDEYNRLSKRFTFLTEQKDDLVEAKRMLFLIIAEMDEEMEKRFNETFIKIKAEFTIVFKELFGGGHAELNLTDPENTLDTGVEIIAQPPGKKMKHLGLLSGGEKALTAIALLFSILRVRPVPFCVLDEVEAALDEANVIRFAKYVKSHSEKTQFIVITHRKGTMEEADVLYGVTMQEPGVSRLVSVLLEDTLELVGS